MFPCFIGSLVHWLIGWLIWLIDLIWFQLIWFHVISFDFDLIDWLIGWLVDIWKIDIWIYWDILIYIYIMVNWYTDLIYWFKNNIVNIYISMIYWYVEVLTYWNTDIDILTHWFIAILLNWYSYTAKLKIDIPNFWNIDLQYIGILVESYIDVMMYWYLIYWGVLPWYRHWQR
jgi:hypothetical protein